jgi:hypothetical protein
VRISLPRGPRLLVAVACAVVALMFLFNRDNGGDPDSPRGDGVYRPVLARGDGHMLYLMALSTALDGDWRFDNELARFGDPWNEPLTKTGRKQIVHPIGAALVWTPLVWLASGTAVVANLFGADIPLHGYTAWHQRIVFASSVLAAWLAILLGLRVASRLVGGRWAPSYAAAAVLLGTPLTYYATFMPSYSHALDAGACGAFLAYWALTVGRRDWRRYVILGALLGLATLIRPQELALGIVVAIEVARSRTWRDFAGGALVLAVAIVVWSPQFLEWHVVFGDAMALPQGARYTRPGAPMLAEVLWSARNGWFSTTPIAYAGVIGLFLVPKRARFVGYSLLAALALQVYLNSTILDWWGGAAFGQRRLCNVTLPLVVGLAALLWRLGVLARRFGPRALHWTCAVIGGAIVAVNLVRVGALAHGKSAPSGFSPTCCDSLPAPLRAIASPIYSVVGNPFEFPANAAFALKHGVTLSRWDRVVGDYPLAALFGDASDDAKLGALHGSWNLANPAYAAYLVGDWSAPSTLPRPHRVIHGRGTVLVPNDLPYGQRIALWLAPAEESHVELWWNGVRVAGADLHGWTQVAFTLPHVALHTNELEIRGSVSVGELDLAMLPLEP